MACSGSGNDKTDLGDSPYCDDTVTVLGVDDVGTLGFSGQDMLALAEGTHDETFVWTRTAESSALSLVVRHDGGEVRQVESEAVYPEGTTVDIGIECPDRIEVDVAVTFETADGAFAEAWDLALVAVSAGTVAMDVVLDPDALGGSYDMNADITDPDWDDRGLWASGRFETARSSGEITGQVSGGDDDCQDGEVCTAWSGMVDVGRWGVEQ